VVSKQVDDRQAQFKNRKALSRRRKDNILVLADGQNGDWTPHDLRRTGATMMQRQSAFSARSTLIASGVVGLPISSAKARSFPQRAPREALTS